MGVTGKTIRTLQGLPFDNLIGGPLNACILAQAQAAQTTVNFGSVEKRWGNFLN